MAGMSTVSGITTLMIDGVAYALAEDSIKFSMYHLNSEPVVSKGGGIFIKQTPTPAKVAFSILVPSNVDVSTFVTKTASNIVAHLASGFVFNMASFCVSGEGEYDAAEGKLSLEFFGSRINVSAGV